MLVRGRGALEREASLRGVAEASARFARQFRSGMAGGGVMDPETLLDVLAAIPGVQVVEGRDTRRLFSGWPKVEVTLALDPREPTPPEFTVRIGEAAKPEPLPSNVTIVRDPPPLPARTMVDQLAEALGVTGPASWSGLLSKVRALAAPRDENGRRLFR